MKLIITENKINKIISNFLDTYISLRSTSHVDSFIIVYNEDMESDDIIGDPSILFEYDFYDGRLYINEKWFLNFITMFGLKEVDGYKIVDEWFEDTFNVEVNPEVR